MTGMDYGAVQRRLSHAVGTEEDLVGVMWMMARRLTHGLRDLREEWRRRNPPPHQGDPRHGLLAGQIYPFGRNMRDNWAEAARTSLRGVRIGKETAVASIGSCFAEEISRLFREKGYNYLVLEPNVYHFSAAWGRVWTIPNLAQIVDYSLDLDVPSRLAGCARGFFDPLREMEGFEPDRGKAEQVQKTHREMSRRVFAEARVLFVTLGQNEAWRDRRSGLVWARLPPKDTAGDHDLAVETFTFEDNCARLERTLRRLLDFNPELSIVLTVSPVAAWATFFDDDVVTRSFGNKCLLRAVASRMIETFPERVGYFPSFEIVLADNRGTFKADNRHVKYGTVNRIFSALTKASL